MAERVEQEITARELAIVSQILAEPDRPAKDSWFWHLPNRTDATKSPVLKMVEALGRLPNHKRGGSENARQLWRLLASQSDAVLAPHRRRLVGRVGGLPKGLSYDIVRDFLSRVDAAVLAKRAVIFERLRQKGGDLPSDLLLSFCRAGATVPDKAKQRLLTLWRRRGEPRGAGYANNRDLGHAMLYFALARLGLKPEAGKVEQRCLGPSFINIWERAGLELPVTECLPTPISSSLGQGSLARLAAMADANCGGSTGLSGDSSQQPNSLLAGNAMVPAETLAKLQLFDPDAKPVMCGHGVVDLERSAFFDNDLVVLYAGDELVMSHCRKKMRPRHGRAPQLQALLDASN